MEEENKDKKTVNYNRLAGGAFIAAGFAWLATGADRPLAISLLALGIVFLTTSKNKKQ